MEVMSKNVLVLAFLVVVVLGLIAILIERFKKPSEKIPESDSSDFQEMYLENNLLTSENDLLKNETKELKKERQDLNEQLQKLNLEKGELTTKLTLSEKNLVAQKDALKQTQETLQKDFERLANKILQEKTDRFKRENQQELGHILKPLKENIEKFEKTVKDNYDAENKERATLKGELNNLFQLNKQLSTDATNLTNALKGDNKTQGDWGEAQLEVILEKSGLQKGMNFRTQITYKDEDDNNQRPDFIIDLPEGKNLIIDAKVSLTAYERYCSTENPEDQKGFLSEHISSIKQHVKGLSGKRYQDLYKINSPDYVLLFVPIESALTLALTTQQEIFNDALNKNIILVSATTLMATMRTVAFIWKQENQKENVQEMARQCGALYDKFVSFTEDLLKVGGHMNTAKKSYEDAMNKLSDGRGNITRKVENIKNLGAKTSKSIDEKLLNRSLNEQ